MTVPSFEHRAIACRAVIVDRVPTARTRLEGLLLLGCMRTLDLVFESTSEEEKARRFHAAVRLVIVANFIRNPYAFFKQLAA